MNKTTQTLPQNEAADEEKTERNSSEIEKHPASLSPPTFRRAHSDEEFKTISKQIAQGMVKSLNEAEPD
jgi:hypothetical protein